MLIIISSLCSAEESETISVESIKSLSGTSFGKIIENCKANYKNQELCIKHRECTSKDFKAIDEDYFYQLTSEYREYIHRPKDEETEYCYGEPNEMRAVVYKSIYGELLEIGSIANSGCSLSIDSRVQYKSMDILKATCSYTGTGSFFDEIYYKIENETLKPIHYDKSNLKIPHDPLGYDRFTINPNSIDYHSGSHSKYCNCLESFSAQLEIKEKSNGDLFFSYIENTYKPFFRTKSNTNNKKGLVFYQDKKYSEAAEEFILATELDVSNYEAFSNLGLTYIKLSKLEEAIEVLDNVYEESSGQQKANAAYNIGLAHEKAGELEKSLRYYTESDSIKTSRGRKKAIERVEKHLTNKSTRMQ